MTIKEHCGHSPVTDCDHGNPDLCQGALIRLIKDYKCIRNTLIRSPLKSSLESSFTQSSYTISTNK